MLTVQAALMLMIFGVGVGFGAGYLIRILVGLSKKNSIELDIKKMMMEAKEKAKEVILDAEKEASETLRSSREETKEREDRIQSSEEHLHKKELHIQEQEKDVQKEADELRLRALELKDIKDNIEQKRLEIDLALQETAGMDKEKALDRLLETVQRENEEALLSRMRKLDAYSEEKIEQKAKETLTLAIQRLATSVPAELFTTHVSIESEDIKGKIIGKEGRNIKTFEKMTGVEVLVDETQGSITLSCFDPIRRQIARIALENLIQDGRIQPAKIEKEIELAEKEIQKIIKAEGERAVYDLGITNLDPKLMLILGRLYFRTSYGQNVLQHSVECAHLAGMLAEELGANVNTAKTAALVHDIGKALDHEVQGSHVEIGRKILQKFDVPEDVIVAMQSHHEEYPYESIEARIVQTADAISGGRTGARKDNIEQYIKRLTDLEDIALSEKGAEKAYALQAGRELRVFVTPRIVSDIDAKNMAINIAKKIEQELKYPGEIKVTVIRELRIHEHAR